MMIDLNKSLTVLVNSCDDYKDVWPLFFSAVEEYWSDHVKIVLNSESVTYLSKKNIYTHLLNPKHNNYSWGFRLRETLKEIETKYVLALFDDFILEDYVDQNELSRIIEKMEKNSEISVVYLTKTDIPKKENSILFDASNDNSYVEVEDNVDFRLNSAPGLWRVEELLKYTGSIEDPWAWEVFGSYKTFNNDRKFFSVEDSGKDVFKYNYSKGGAIYRGKWVREIVENKNEKYKLNIDFKERGFSNSDSYEKRNFLWKAKFLKTGYNMVGFKVLNLIVSTLKRKKNDFYKQ